MGPGGPGGPLTGVVALPGKMIAKREIKANKPATTKAMIALVMVGGRGGRSPLGVDSVLGKDDSEVVSVKFGLDS